MNTLKGRYQNHQVDEENPYWISFSDIMAGLLVIFVLAAVALILELTQKSEQWDEAIKEIAKAEQVRKDLLREIEQELNAMNIPVKISDNDTVLRIPEDVLTFAQGRFDIPGDEKSQRIALDIGKVLFASITKDERWKYLDTIFVEGHTDRVPYRNRSIKGNWGLSTFRAISVWNYWNQTMDEGFRLDMLNNHLGKKLFSVSGYAETRPVPCSNAGSDINDRELCPTGILDEEESLRKNRRIDIRFTVRRPALEDYQAIKQALD
ncbi:flagellar motor protein MotB [Ketobacter sp. GenoA1]|uniref:OmpA/MotB family protein n=1 Tax=Ketobacter sp. GenoA1 TaxID=2072747 RepID=UPI000F1E315D|nr:OmpA family protein [Ketobacter sp. GenoA1]RLT90793.1 MAG: chemotaxis protein MotB [Ketobacter sp. GenoA1]